MMMNHDVSTLGISDRDNRDLRFDFTRFFSAPAKRYRKNDTQPPPVEAKLLDDLFKRTKTSPSIYWLPLSEDQVCICSFYDLLEQNIR